MHRFEDLEVWHMSYALALDVYRDTRSFPREERFGLVQQMRRCAASVPANIAEGSRRLTPAQFRYFLGIGSGSNAELDVFLRFSIDLAFIPKDVGLDRRNRNHRIHRMLRSLILNLPRK